VTYDRAQADLAQTFPALADLIRRIGSVQVRNAGTVGGNIANASPIGDLPPALIALGARLRLQKAGTTRELTLEDYFIGYGRQDRRAAEFVESVFVPRPKPTSVLKVYKVSKRFEQDISAVCGAFHLVLDGAGQKIASARICFGGMAGTPARARRCEAFLAGKPLAEDVLAEAVAILESEFEPISDWRASARYRRKVAGNLLRRCFVEISTGRELQLSARQESADAC
jgi:xanthine dehydrogenase small subunit